MVLQRVVHVNVLEKTGKPHNRYIVRMGKESQVYH